MVEQTQAPRRIAGGREAEVYAWDERHVLKLYRDERLAANARIEAAGMRAAKAAGGPVPEPGEEMRYLDRPGLLMERVDGENLFDILAKKPWMLFRAGAILGETHARLHEAIAGLELPSVHERFRRRIERAVEEAPEYRGLAEFALRALDAMPEGDRLLHGDFHPGNVLMTKAGPMVIDWPNAMRGDPHADVARVLLVFDVASVPPDAPGMIRLLEKFGRRILRSRYIASYRRLRRLDAGLLERWRVPVAAQRLTDGIEDEREKLLALLERARRVGA